MGDIKLFQTVNGQVGELLGTTDTIEKSVQTLFEKNLEALLGVREISLEPGFTRDVSQVGHFGTGDLEITLSKSDDLERAKPLIQRSYDAS